MTSDVIPGLRYRDALAAIDFLERAFGFRRGLVVAEGLTVHHAQLHFGQGGMVMLGSVRPDDAHGTDDAGWNGRIVQPDTLGGAETQTPYVVVADVDAHAAQAEREGARILRAPADQPYGGRDYAALDPEGRLWFFGSYDPWAVAADDRGALLAAAAGVRRRAHAPYSGYAVGAALRDEHGRIHVGANVENAAYPQSQCAEASAIGALIAAGARRVTAVAISGQGPKAITPCGGCRQRLREFGADDLPVWSGDETGRPLGATTLGALLPDSFGPDHLVAPGRLAPS